MPEHQLLREILGELKVLNQRVASLDDRLAGLDARINVLDARVAGLDMRVANLEERFNNLDTRLTGLEERFNNLEERFNNFDIRLAGLEERFNDLAAGQEQLWQALARIESEHGEKLAALCDGFKLRGDQLEELKRHLDHRLDSIALDLAYLVSKVASHEVALIKLVK
ncbi:hypothetical protein [Desulfovirgula thermocuniculi]|uniref:hypothetical protein n=1 Tax=Desulfovirgula thermocuniculi TaxID=348842 RepID=UPI00041F4E2F|nr:hypothetical protein [Desulfovirgula thermocuniculi]